MRKASDYTVGWICARITEYVAAQVILDEEHGVSDYLSDGDNNDYTLGKIGEHNVVITVLPDGEYGTASAAAVARDMLHSFPAVRIGLMVGIGGGAPMKHDIRLGDVVVSTPRDSTPGVFQYDFGKTIQGQSFQPTKVLNNPPAILRNAVNGIRVKHARHGHGIEESINALLQKNPRLQRGYKKPDPASDQLFKPEITHKELCGAAGECERDPSNLIKRRARTESEDNPTIHYGLIASGNQLMKDAVIRDKLSAENDILCFEMEAAGLMNHFPCLVIRGICDYSDSHKNDDWQGYAAMTAAMYAKDLLTRIAPKRVEAEKRAAEILSKVLDAVSRTETNISRMKSMLDKEDMTILNWLTDIDQSSQQSANISQREAGTVEWLLNSTAFHAWLHRDNQTLFCPGIPGAGKTVATSVVIDFLCRNFQNDKSIGIAFAFCSYQQSVSCTELLRSLLRQLAQFSMPEAVISLYRHHSPRGTFPSPDEIFDTLRDVVAGHSKTFIIIDALDECKASDGTRSKIITQLFRLQNESNTNLFMTSRHVSEITDKLEKRGCSILEIRAAERDVRKYIEHQLSSFPAFIQETPGLKEEITTAIINATDGMFLLAKLHIESLRCKTSAMKIDDALERLPKGSDAYYETYDNAMKRIKGQQKEYSELAIQVLTWITQARRPMRKLELQHALAVTANSSALNPRNLPDIELAKDICTGLIIYEEQSDVVRLVHYTTQEYFEQSWASWFPSANQYISTVLLTYLSYDHFSRKPAEDWMQYNQKLEENCLYDYAARYWGHYAKVVYPEVKDITARFLRNNQKIASAAQVLLVQPGNFGILKVPEGVTGLHIAAFFGIEEEVVELLRGSFGPHIPDSFGQTALHWAVKNGQEHTVELLLKEGLDVNAADMDMKSALHYAASQDNPALIRLLVKCGAMIEARDIQGQTPLMAAAVDVRVKAAKELLSHGDQANAVDSMSRNALHLATLASRREASLMTDLLLSHDVDFTTCDVENMTPFLYAVGRGNTSILDSLLQAGADINLGIERKYWAKTTDSGRRAHWECRTTVVVKGKIKDATGLTPLHFAACIGHTAMTEYLLDRGANPNARCYNGDTPLHVALRRSIYKARSSPRLPRYGVVLPDDDEWTQSSWYVEISADFISDYEGEEAQEIFQYIEEERLAVVKSLVARPTTDVNIRNIDLCSPLHTVQYHNCNSEVIVDELLLAGADIFARNEKGQTAMHLACKSGASAIACNFLDKGCCITTVDSQGLSALHYAVSANKYDTVEVILGTDKQLARRLCRERDARGRNLLHYHLTASTCSLEMVIVLLHHGTCLTDVDQDGNTPISLYLRGFRFEDRTEIVCFLLQHGADALWTSSEGQNLAHLAMHNHTAEPGVFNALKAHGVDLAARDDSGKNILHHGAIGGSLSKEIMDFFRQNSPLDLAERDKEGKTPLLYAREAANKKRSRDVFAGNRWKHTLENLIGAVEGGGDGQTS